MLIKIITVLLFSIFIFGYHTWNHLDNSLYDAYGNSNQRYIVTCFKTGEYTQALYKVCQYSCAGIARPITRSNKSLCPISIRGNWVSH